MKNKDGLIKLDNVIIKNWKPVGSSLSSIARIHKLLKTKPKDDNQKNKRRWQFVTSGSFLLGSIGLLILRNPKKGSKK